MIELMVLTYGSILFVLFKFLKLPVNKWTVTTSILVGFLGIGWLLLTMNYYHPFTSQARLYTFTTPILPDVRGRVIEVPVKGDTPLKAGDVLFKIDPRPYQYAVDQARAALAAAEGERDFNRGEFERSTRLAQKGAASDREVQSWQERLDKAVAAVDQANSKLLDAQFDLDQTVVRAPTDGFVTQVVLRPGMMAVPMPLRPVMVFVHEENRPFVAAFPQNSLQNIQPGYEAEVIFPALPGRVFKGKVDAIIDALAQGQIQATGDLIDPESRPRRGRVPVRIAFDEDLSAFRLPGGSVGEVAVYSEHWHVFAIIRRILLRMASWENYVFLG